MQTTKFNFEDIEVTLYPVDAAATCVGILLARDDMILADFQLSTNGAFRLAMGLLSAFAPKS